MLKINIIVAEMNNMSIMNINGMCDACVWQESITLLTVMDMDPPCCSTLLLLISAGKLLVLISVVVIQTAHIQHDSTSIP